MSDLKSQDISPDSRDYDIHLIEEDPRFIQCKKEVLISVALWGLLTVLLMIGIYVIGGRGYENYKFILGMPDYLFFICASVLAVTVIVLLVINKFFKNMDLDKHGTIEESGK